MMRKLTSSHIAITLNDIHFSKSCKFGHGLYAQTSSRRPDSATVTVRLWFNQGISKFLSGL